LGRVKYYVTVGDREFEVLVDGDRVTVDGEEYHAHLTAIPETPLRHLLIGTRSFTLPFVNRGAGQWEMAFQGETWQAAVMDERTRHIRSLTGAGEAKKGGGVLKAPMPGLVVRVDVEPGDALEPGRGIVVLEAMKMQNELRAAGPVVVKAVLVRAGQPVEKGQVLVEFEDNPRD
jgi:biotin carboxyl carrier protein